jgi:hypothetical protein
VAESLTPAAALELAASEARRRAALPGDEGRAALGALADELDELRGLLLAPPRGGPGAQGRALQQAIEASEVPVEVVTAVGDELRFPAAPGALASALRRLVLVASRGFGAQGVAFECRPATADSVLLTLRARQPGADAGLGLGRLRLDLDLALVRALLDGIDGAIELEASGDQLLALRVELPATADSVAQLRARLVASALASMRGELGAELLVSLDALVATLRDARLAGAGEATAPLPGLVLARQQSHKLRGSAGSCGFPGVSQAAALIEDALIAASGPLSAGSWSRIDEALARMRAELVAPTGPDGAEPR